MAKVAKTLRSLGDHLQVGASVRNVYGANVAHELHLFDVPDTICKQRLRERNAGGEHPFQVSEADYDLFTSYFVPPGPNEGFYVVVHRP
jgi:hypothetical protein